MRQLISLLALSVLFTHEGFSQPETFIQFWEEDQSNGNTLKESFKMSVENCPTTGNFLDCDFVFYGNSGSAGSPTPVPLISLSNESLILKGSSAQDAEPIFSLDFYNTEPGEEGLAASIKSSKDGEGIDGNLQFWTVSEGTPSEAARFDYSGNFILNSGNLYIDGGESNFSGVVNALADLNVTDNAYSPSFWSSNSFNFDVGEVIGYPDPELLGEINFFNEEAGFPYEVGGIKAYFENYYYSFLKINMGGGSGGLMVNSWGQVGIGDFANYDALGDAALNVQGKGKFDEVETARWRITSMSGADFVFDPDYDLKPLHEVESFIKKNKHLPEIESAKEMKENGIEMAEFNIKLLQKIEELTLHTIDQQKIIEAQESRLSEMESAIRELKNR